MHRPAFKRAVLTVAYLAVATFVAWFGYQSHAKLRTTAQMADAANKFLASLSPEQKAKTVLTFDDANRLDWTYVPRERKGLPLKEMNEAQRKLAHVFLQTGLSAYGYKKVTDIISLEPVLRELEGPNRRFPRDETLYFITIYGTPGAKDKWGWRFEGHHVSLNFTIVKGELLNDAPLGLGANPAEVRQGPRNGFRAQANEEDKGRELIQMLDEKQRTTAIFDAKAPTDIFTLGKLKADPLDPKGIAYSQLNAQQKDKLMKLIDEYLARVPDEIAKLRRDQMKKAGLDSIYFGWAGGLNKGDGHYYRIQSKTFLIEYDDTQNNNNHIHTVWRDFNGDFGKDLLAEHYQTTPHKASSAQ
jgi:hypothetical protein